MIAYPLRFTESTIANASMDILGSNPMKPSENPYRIRENESLLEYAQRLKAIDRKRLLALDPEVAQQKVDAILIGNSTPIPGDMTWPGDLADEAEDPKWMKDT